MGEITTSILAVVASFLALVLGIIYMILRLKDLGDKCELIKPEDCNLAWRSIFTLNSVVVFNLLIPTLLGLVGIVLHFRFIIRCVTACLRFAAFIVAITF